MIDVDSFLISRFIVIYFNKKTQLFYSIYKFVKST